MGQRELCLAAIGRVNTSKDTNMTDHEARFEHHANRDPISGTPGSHPVGTGIGALLAGAATGAVTGTAAGPVGTLIGAALGAVVGGLAGKGVAEVLDPTSQDTFWSESYNSRPYVRPGASFDDFGPAYGYGVDAFWRHPGQHFDDIEAELARGWERARRSSSLDWQGAKLATRDAWNRLSDSVERAIPGDSDRDGR